MLLQKHKSLIRFNKLQQFLIFENDDDKIVISDQFSLSTSQNLSISAGPNTPQSLRYS